MSEFIPITFDGDLITSPMPADETVVHVRLKDGSVMCAWFACNIMDAGDWDFVPLGPDGEGDIEADSIADKVDAWCARNGDPGNA